MTAYPRYKVIKESDEILQGDIILKCPIFVPDGEIKDNRVSGDSVPYNIVVMSQSCDLEHNKVEIVLVSPFFSLEEVQEANNHLKSARGKRELVEGNLIGYHLLNKYEDENITMLHQIVDFRSVFGAHISLLKNICRSSKYRLRLLPPYREHISQAFARFFMRVGLPEEYDPIP